MSKGWFAGLIGGIGAVALSSLLTWQIATKRGVTAAPAAPPAAVDSTPVIPDTLRSTKSFEVGQLLLLLMRPAESQAIDWD